MLPMSLPLPLFSCEVLIVERLCWARWRLIEAAHPLEASGAGEGAKARSSAADEAESFAEQQLSIKEDQTIIQNNRIQNEGR